MTTALPTAPARSDLAAFGSTATVAVVDHTRLVEARVRLRRFIDAFDRACSRFRSDSELAGLGASGGAPVTVSPLLAGAIRAALDAAAMTGGLVDPTVGGPLSDAGYDRDLAALEPRPEPARASAAPGWSQVALDDDTRTVTLPPDVRLDLGATGKAYAADLAAAALATELRCGVLVSFGGDVAVSGQPPAGGWVVHATEPSTTEPPTTPSTRPVPTQAVVIESGGLATSSTLLRHWRRGGVTLHHILDPATGTPAPVVWRTVSVAAARCVDANAASTAAVILGHEAPDWLRDCGLPARLVGADGQVIRVGGWPAGPPATAVADA